MTKIIWKEEERVWQLVGGGSGKEVMAINTDVRRYPVGKSTWNINKYLCPGKIGHCGTSTTFKVGNQKG